MFDNILLLTDSYKASHYRQYPPKTEKVYSYFESRGGKFDEVVFFGLNYYLQHYLSGVVVTQQKIEEAATFCAAHFGDDSLFYREGWEYILHQHGGRLPVSIQAVPEGSVVPTHHVLMTVENTDPACYWLTNYLETLLVQVWYGSTVATLSREMKKLILKALRESGDPDAIDFKLHDFGFRGVSSVESAAVGGAAHLINFKGSDTLVGCLLAQKYYAEAMAGFSIPASEHSTMTSWGRAGELDAYANMLEQYPTGLVAVVSDSYDVYAACESLWGEKLRERILQRDGTLVVRPDSGYPPEVVLNILNILGQKFGRSLNAQGFFELPPQVRVIQGDGIDYEMTQDILQHIQEHQWSANNISFGMGGGLLQKLHRDTQKFAFKCSQVVVNGQARDVFKQPMTDQGKASKKGRLKLIQRQGQYHTVAEAEAGDDLLREVFCDGEVLLKENFTNIRQRARVSI
ncbi:MAG: nicotinate phosphoribosyltransferase [Mariprofundaceae bacterium]|nr:nicotinate phosphoribosyltransferase [Mariprofundaceae bacterium]